MDGTWGRVRTKGGLSGRPDQLRTWLSQWFGLLIFLSGFLGTSPSILAEDVPHVRVRFRVPGTAETPGSSPPVVEKTLEGRLRIQAVDGSLLLEDRFGALWPIMASQSPVSETMETPFLWMNADELTASLLAEFGEGFEVVRTRHYLICTNAGPGYGGWCGQLFERLHAGFQKFWEERIPGLEAPDRPLVAIAFATREQYQAFQETDAGGQVGAARGYFSARTNRIVLFDQSADELGGNRQTAAEIHKLAVRHPETIGTVIHEAVHQLSFNIGLQTRYADNPAWFSEGLATYFETPDLETRSGWKTIGQVNAARLHRYRLLAKKRTLETRSLIATEDRFRDPQHQEDAYAEAWALHFFLLRTQKEKYDRYLQMLGTKPQLQWDTPDQRVADFEAAFGPLADVEREQAKFMARLRGGR